MTERILIAGAGDLGTRLGLLLARRGHEVFALRRTASQVPAPLLGITGDLSDAASLQALPGGLTRVAYTAAADSSTDAAYEAAYVRGLQNLLGALSHSSRAVRRVVFTSSTAVYAQTDGSWVNEQSETRPHGFSGLRTLEAERRLADSGVSGVVVRAGGVYGPGRTRLLDEVRAGRASYDAEQTEYTNRIHVDDLASVLAFALLEPEPPPLLLAVDDDPAPRRQVLEWLAKELGAPVPQPRDPGMSATRARRSDSNKRVSNALLRSLGVSLQYPTFREGYGALLKAAR